MGRRRDGSARVGLETQLLMSCHDRIGVEENPTDLVIAVRLKRIAGLSRMPRRIATKRYPRSAFVPTSLADKTALTLQRRTGRRVRSVKVWKRSGNGL